MMNVTVTEIFLRLKKLMLSHLKISMEIRAFGLYKKYKTDHENDHTEKLSKLSKKTPEKTMQFTYDMLTKAFKKDSGRT